ncbi:MAG: FIST C-terminal domain-containing protein [Gaiellales bacterium]
MPVYASHLVRHRDPDTAVDVAADHVAAELAGAEATLVVVTASDAFRDDADALRRAVRRRFPAAEVAGAVIAGGVIGRGEEVEEAPAVSLLACAAPIGSFAVRGLDDAADLPVDTGLVVAFADPYTLVADDLGDRADHAGVDLVGGFTGGYGPGSARLIETDGVRTHGGVAIAVGLDGARAVVSQGARPIGPDLVVTAAEGGVVLELAGRPAVEQLHAVLGALDPDDLELARAGLMAGIVIDENRPDYDVGDFLVRGLVGVEAQTGGLAVQARPRVGQTFRFHVRDAAGADHDLRRALAADAPAGGAALVFACNGRGRRMFGSDHHDAAVVDELLGVPVAGAFCQGELGPVAGTNHVHAFTATLAVLPRR